MSLRENFNRFYNSLQKSIEDENWYSALVLAVTLPDICCTLDESKVMVSNNKAHINSNEAYIKWFDKYINDYIWEWYKNGRVTETVVLNGNNAYSIRCEVLHQGGTEISNQRKYDSTLGYKKVKFGLTNEENLKKFSSEFNYGYDEDFLYLNVKKYCKNILRGVEAWLNDYENNPTVNSNSEKLIRIEEF